MSGPTGLREAFENRFGCQPAIARAPGRVNLIGDHTDYNGGLVMPAALDFYSWVAAAPRSDGRMVIESALFDETVDVELAQVRRHASSARATHWSDYPLGVAACLRDAGVPLTGATLMIRGNVPFGAGLSSSASLEVACAGALLAALGRTVAATQLALLCQRAENDYVGMRCGIMDQYIAVFGRAGYALQIDCQRLEHRPIPVAFESMPAGARPQLVICDSQLKHELASSGYNQRRADCEAALDRLQTRLPAISTLSDLTLQDLQVHAALLDATQFKRVRHVVLENERVRRAGEALCAGAATQMGQYMYDSHASLRDDYEVSCDEIDCLVEAARRSPGTYGARMTGGGFGGCTVNLVSEDHLAAFKRQVSENYRTAFGIEPRIFISAIADGLRVLDEGVHG